MIARKGTGEGKHYEKRQQVGRKGERRGKRQEGNRKVEREKAGIW